MILLLAYGNSLRRDDGAGAALGESLNRIWSAQNVACRLSLSHQLFPEDALQVARADVGAVVFCDAEKGGPGKSGRLRFERVFSAGGGGSAGHQFTPQAVLAAALNLYGADPPAWAATVPGADFDHGEGFSAGVTQLLLGSEAFAAELLADIRSVSGEGVQHRSAG
jgi:Ni,Fe-hydrogenase maturation factor